LLVVAGCALIAVVTVLVWPRGEREPEYQGKKLSEWLEVYSQTFPDSSERIEAHRGAARAVREIGTNSLPWILKWIHYERAPWRDGLDRVVKKLPEPLGAEGGVMSGGEFRAAIALHAFEILGPRANSAVPELTRLLNEPGQQTPKNAMTALGCIGKDGLPALLTVLTNGRARDRKHLAFVFRSKRFEGSDLSAAVPVLVRWLGDKDPQIARDAANTLGALAIGSDLAVPALTNSLHATDRVLRICAARSIGSFGNEARAAVPVLLESLSDTGLGVPDAAKSALLKIAPEVLRTNAVSGR
jgi:hypothetical protein